MIPQGDNSRADQRFGSITCAQDDRMDRSAQDLFQEVGKKSKQKKGTKKTEGTHGMSVRLSRSRAAAGIYEVVQGRWTALIEQQQCWGSLECKGIPQSGDT